MGDFQKNVQSGALSMLSLSDVLNVYSFMTSQWSLWGEREENNDGQGSEARRQAGRREMRHGREECKGGTIHLLNCCKIHSLNKCL